jgi:hypothetical protein
MDAGMSGEGVPIQVESPQEEKDEDEEAPARRTWSPRITEPIQPERWVPTRITGEHHGRTKCTRESKALEAIEMTLHKDSQRHRRSRRRPPLSQRTHTTRAVMAPKMLLAFKMKPWHHHTRIARAHADADHRRGHRPDQVS